MDEFNVEHYWNDEYWSKYLENNKNEPEFDFTKDDWLLKYRETFDKFQKGKALDLGCGLGQDTMFLLNEGYSVVSLDISEKSLNELKKKIPDDKTIRKDMSKELPFSNEEFALVFANLSTHYYNWRDTKRLYNEIKRLLKPGGIFIGRVNSIKTLINDVKNPILIEENYYFEKRYLRYFTEKQFARLFTKWHVMVLNETTTNRWKREKVLWEFIVQK